MPKNKTKDAPVEYPWPVLTGIFVSAALALAGLVQFRQLAAEPSPFTRDVQQVRPFVDAFSDLRATLPEDEVLGFISNAGGDAVSGAFMKARYALAPRLLLDNWQNSRARWVVGVFAQQPDLAALRQQHLAVAKDFGNGLVLFRREDRP